MTWNGRTIPIDTFEDFDRELARDGGETLEVAAYLADEYGLFPEEVGIRGGDRGRLGRPARRRRGGGGRPMNHDEYHRKFADAIIEQISQGRRAVAEAVGAGRAGAAHERGHRPLLPGRQQPAPGRRSAGAGLRRRALGHLPPDPGPGRTGQEGRARHPHPLLPGQEADRRDRRARAARGGTARARSIYRYEKLKAPVVRQYTVFNAEQADGLPERANPTPEPLWKAHQDAERVMEDGGVPIRHVAGRPRLLPHEARRDRAARARTVPVRQPLLPDRAPRAGPQHRPRETA